MMYKDLEGRVKLDETGIKFKIKKSKAWVSPILFNCLLQEVSWEMRQES